MFTEWGYNKTNGPLTWSDYYPAASGDKQSPIDINPVHQKNLHPIKRLTWKYNSENSETITNTGCGWRVDVNGKRSELFGGPLEEKYILQQFHCHWGATNNKGSEHTVNGKQYAGELHLVHFNSKYGSFEEACQHPDGLCVLGIFLKVGRSHYELGKIVAELKHVHYKDKFTKLNLPVDPGSFIPQFSGYWTYQGSLTTPPCLECVIWIVFEDPIEISHEQLNSFRSLRTYCSEDFCPSGDFEEFVQNNFRPTLPLGSREIRKCSH